MDDMIHTPSGIPIKPVYGREDLCDEPPAPGAFPFTRGNFASGYRGKTWTFRQYSGFGTAEDSSTPTGARPVSTHDMISYYARQAEVCPGHAVFGP